MRVAEIAKLWNFSFQDVRIFWAERLFCYFILENYEENKQFLPSKTDPRLHPNWKNFEGAVNIADKLRTTIYRYYQTLFYRLRDDGDWKIYPNMISSSWAINRYVAISGVIPPILTEKNEAQNESHSILSGKKFIEWKMRSINLEWKYPDNLTDFFCCTKAIGLPPISFQWIEQGFIPKSFLAISRDFYQAYENLPDDIKSLYIDEKMLDSLHQKLLTNIPTEQLYPMLGGPLSTQSPWRKK